MTYVSNDPARWPFLSNAHLASYLIALTFGQEVRYIGILYSVKQAPCGLSKTSVIWSEEVSSQSCTLCARQSHEGWVESKDQWCTLDNTYVTATESGYSSFDSPWGLDGQY
ncbi:hypothetical protein EV702DRAFT_1044734 [Suillus placidus]|uniref:Uncharacterized protein n=1 Tax=Suillus placidus TaxID=48579 RepID=A0A9P6ZWD1_9AGAM|nr:hypothetical protein EV702DRAFT_1044734 [Suillus placidus]